MLEQYTFNTDPLLVLLRAECETVEDEDDVTSMFEQHETFVLAAQHKSPTFETQE